MTEIPEHLLKRSQARKQELSGTATPATTESSGAATPAPRPTPTPATTSPAPKVELPEPDYIVSAKSRAKIPYWAMATLSLLPLWAFLYLIALQPKEVVAEGPMAVGATVFGSCAGCHGAAGQGGAGRILHEGEALATFPHIEDMLNFVYTGSQLFVAADLPVYGDPDREGGARVPLSYNGNPMPMQGQSAGGALTEYEILGVVCHVRYDIAGADPTSEQWAAEYERWCSPESEIFASLEAGTTSFDTLHTDFSSLMPEPPRAIGTTARASAG